MQIDLTGRTVLVTGASRGIGHALATALAAAGATVAVHYHRTAAPAEALAARLRHGAQAFQANLAEIDACEQLMDEVLAAYGRLDVLVNNAGVSPYLPLDLPTRDWAAGWAETMHVNLRAAELLGRRALQHFLATGGGRILNIASRAAFRGDTADYVTYAASKGGLVALTRSLARAYGKQGVRAFTLAPGFVRTDMAQDFIETYGEAYVQRDIALETLTEPADLAPLVVLLASGLADHATGCTIDVNAGSYVH